MRVTLIQMNVEMGDVEGNLSRAEYWIREAGKAGADFAVLPECMDTGWTYPDAPKLAQPIPGKLTEMFAKLAQETRMYIVAGFTEKAEEGIFNTAILIDRSGKIIHKHRKVMILDIASDIYNRGSSVGVVETEFGCVSLLICADIFVSELAGAAAIMGARYIFCPSSWACDEGQEEANDLSLKRHFIKRTTEKEIYLFGANHIGRLTAGVWKGKIVRGRSIAYGPGGALLAQGEFNKEELVVVDL